MPIRWIFFDMGGVLIDDQQLMCFFYRKLYERSLRNGSISNLGDIFSLREKLIESGDGFHWRTACMNLMGNGWEDVYSQLISKMREQYVEMNRLFPGMDEIVWWVKESFNTGLAANQFVECRGLLEKFNLLGSFDVFGISEEIGYKKPQREFFEWLINESGAEPEECIMIGDRIDNDVIPAKELGMKTIWLRLPPDYDALFPGDEFRDAYAASHRRASLHTQCPSCDSEEPHGKAQSVLELRNAISKIAGNR